MTADTRGMTEGVQEYAVGVEIALIESKGLDAFQAVGLVSCRPFDVLRFFTAKATVEACAEELMKFYNVSRKTP